jgi:endonuclease YncB( thermonuclease family)
MERSSRRFSEPTILVVALVLAQMQAKVANACATPGIELARVAAVDQGLVLRLADGRSVRLPAIEPTPRGAEAARSALASWLVGSDVRLGNTSRPPDRWGRLNTHVHGKDFNSDDLLVALALVDAGWARVRPEAANDPCLPGLLAAESGARSRREGLWADGSFAVLKAEGNPALVRRIGEWVLVEGRIRTVRETPARIWLNFGLSRSVDLTVTISRHHLSRFGSAGVSPKDYVGRTVRVRGLLEARSGPQIEVAGPESIEMLAAASASAR